MSDRGQVFATDRWSALTSARFDPLASDQRTGVSALHLKIRLRLRWVFAATIAFFLPKCLVCIAGYLAVLTGLTAVNPELCGAGGVEFSNWRTYVLTGLGVAALAGGVFWFRSGKCMRVSGNGAAKR